MILFYIILYYGEISIPNLRLLYYAEKHVLQFATQIPDGFIATSNNPQSKAEATNSNGYKYAAYFIFNEKRLSLQPVSGVLTILR